MAKINIDEKFCKGFHLCVNSCPKQALRKDGERNAKGYIVPKKIDENCITCRTCEVVCPDMAIYITEE